MPNHQLIWFTDDDALARAVADRWLGELENCADAAAPYGVALSGGRIAKKLFAAADEGARTRSVSFAETDFFWSDERCVAPTDAGSNFARAHALLLDSLGISLV